MSSPKKRHVVYDIGEIANAAPSKSNDFDLSSCTNAIIHLTRNESETLIIYFEATPVPPGETASESDWFPIYYPQASTTGVGVMAKSAITWGSGEPDGASFLFGGVTFSGVMDFRSPRRSRISIEFDETSTTITSFLVEGTRVIA